MNEWREKEIKEMIGFLSARSSDEIGAVFDVILTPREINDMAKRFKIRQLLEEGKTYSEIQTEVGVSCDMVSRVSGKIGYGFRRSYSIPRDLKKEQASKKGYRRKSIRYKGAAPITDIIFPKG